MKDNKKASEKLEEINDSMSMHSQAKWEDHYLQVIEMLEEGDE